MKDKNVEYLQRAKRLGGETSRVRTDEGAKRPVSLGNYGNMW